MSDETQEFLDSLPELARGEQFNFACHAGIACYTACCSNLTMPLTPYDVLRLRQGLGEEYGSIMPSEIFIQTYADVSYYPATGFPQIYLRMEEDPMQSCPFVTEEGCTVYAHRSSACRTYPLGRATKEDDEGNVVEQFFVVQEEHCKGFAEPESWTSATWLTDQGLQAYLDSNDRYMHLMARYIKKLQQETAEQGATLPKHHATMAFLALYQPDNFLEFIKNMKIFSRLSLSEEEQQAILSDEEARLNFAFDWMELVLFGNCKRLKPLK